MCQRPRGWEVEQPWMSHSSPLCPRSSLPLGASCDVSGMGLEGMTFCGTGAWKQCISLHFLFSFFLETFTTVEYGALGMKENVLIVLA